MSLSKSTSAKAEKESEEKANHPQAVMERVNSLMLHIPSLQFDFEIQRITYTGILGDSMSDPITDLRDSRLAILSTIPGSYVDRARDTETSIEELEALAFFYPNIVADNPALTLYAVSHPNEYQRIIETIRSVLSKCGIEWCPNHVNPGLRRKSVYARSHDNTVQKSSV